MNCQEAHGHMYGFLDDETGVVRRLRIRWHLYRCPPCGKGYAFEYALRLRVRRGCSDDMPAELSARLRALLREQTDGNQG
ncbi:MAG TPA: zf-HC2 domain-containing protein [Acidimicrobiia bacterium]